MIYFLVILFNCLIKSHHVNVNWGYRILFDDHDIFLPNKWYKINKNCLGKSQSPININYEQTEYDKNLTNIEMTFNELKNETWLITNIGYTRKRVY